MLIPLITLASLIEMENEYIKIIGDTDTGRFIIKTTGGDPQLESDQNALLLYEDYPPTSFATIRIDNRDYKFGDTEIGGIFVTPIMKRDDRMFCSWSYKNIEVSQTLRFVKGPTTGNLDTVEISYTIWNKDTREHNIGLRIMLDTYLGKEDGAPFRIPNIGDVTTETCLSNENLPEYWYSYDDLSEPTVRAQGSVIIPGEIKPDKIVFASWERFNKYLWDFEFKPGRNFRRSVVGPPDSAVAIYFNSRNFKPNDNFTFKTYYGLYGAALYKGKIFNVSLSGPVTAEDKPFLITADVQNISPYKSENTTAEIILPQGLKILGDEPFKKELASLAPKEIKKSSWNVFADGSFSGVVTYKVKIQGNVNNKIETEITERTINIKPIQKPQTITYTIYDFTEINKLINEINELLKENNQTLNEINKMLKTKSQYPENDSSKHRNEIKERINKAREIETKLPETLNTVIKEKK